MHNQRSHIIIIDGTQSRMEDGHETNAGLLYKLLQQTHDAKTQTLWYHPGIQGHGLWNWVTLASGWGINQTIRDAYSYISSKYRPGDRLYLFGYSRGAYAVRSLAGMINTLGLLRRRKAIERHVKRAFYMYEYQEEKRQMKKFCDEHCHMSVDIEVIGVWDTVKALGIEYPIVSRLASMATEFHNDRIGGAIKNGFHALALDETRTAYAPVLWNTDPDWTGHLEQVWFRGAHSDVGGHVWKYPAARPLANISLVWMLERISGCGLELATDWKTRFLCDVTAPKLGDKRGIAKFFLFRQRREIGRHPSEFLHKSVVEHDPNADYGIPVQQK